MDIQKITNLKIELQHQIPVRKFSIFIHKSFQLSKHGHQLQGKQLHITQKLIICAQNSPVADPFFLFSCPVSSLQLQHALIAGIQK